jgi:HSP20 family protein
MPLTPWKSLWETRFPSFREEMNKVFQDFFSTARVLSLEEGGVIPRVDVHETRVNLVITMDIPAINPENISVSVIEDKLTVKGERKKEKKETAEEEFYRIEKEYGSFQRIVQLPKGVVGARARATYKDGVLTIAIPRSRKPAPKEIKVSVK